MRLSREMDFVVIAAKRCGGLSRGGGLCVQVGEPGLGGKANQMDIDNAKLRKAGPRQTHTEPQRQRTLGMQSWDMCTIYGSCVGGDFVRFRLQIE